MNYRGRNKNLAILYVLSMAFACNTLYGNIQLSYKPQIIVGLIWIILGLCLRIYTNRQMDKDLCFFLKLYLTPHIVIHVYTIFLIILGKVPIQYFTTNLKVYVPTILAIVSIYIFGNKAFYYNIYSVILSWFVSVFVSLISKGPLIIPHAILEGWLNIISFAGIERNYFELHDIVLSVGFLLCFYLFSREKLSLKNLKIILLVLLIMILGVKKIAILGVLIAVFFYILIKKYSENKKYIICIFAGVAIIIFSYIYIYIMMDDRLVSWLLSVGIDPRGRQYYYQALLSLVEFSPTFIGLGRNSVAHIFSTQLSYLKVAGVHSDIIKMYVESGFIMFSFWLFYNCIYILSRYKKKFGNKAAVIYFSILIYLFSLYFTDNVENYFVSQVLSITIPLTYALNAKETIKNKIPEKYCAI